MAKKRRDYQNDYPSVTQCLDVLRKIGLEQWFKMNTLEYINRESSKGRTVGTQIHDAIEGYIIEGKTSVETEYKDEVITALKSFMLFRTEHPEIKLELSEMALTSENHKFNGQIDCIGEINGSKIILDWKTSQCKDKEKPDIYDEYVYQVSAYVNLYNECKGEKIDKAIIVSIAKDKIAYNMEELDEVRINDCFNEVFLPSLKITNYKRRK